MYIKREIKLKDGSVISRNTQVEKVYFINDRIAEITFTNLTRKIKLRNYNLGKYIKGFMKEPSLSTLKKWESEGYCKTVTGEIVEPDGIGSDGAPSWLLVLGYI